MGFERLRVYQAAQRLDTEVGKLISIVPRGNSTSVKQVERSAGSILFNIAEVYAADSLGKKRNHLEIARGEADEVRSILRRLVSKGALTESGIRRACELTSVIAKVLTSWMDNLK